MTDELVVRGFDIGNLKGQPLRRVVLKSDPYELEVILGREDSRVLIIIHALKGDAFDNVRALTNTGPDFSGLLISATRPAAEILAASLEHAAVELRKQLALTSC